MPWYPANHYVDEDGTYYYYCKGCGDRVKEFEAVHCTRCDAPYHLECMSGPTSTFVCEECEEEEFLA